MSIGILHKGLSNLDENLDFLSHFLYKYIGLGFLLLFK